MNNQGADMKSNRLKVLAIQIGIDKSRNLYRGIFTFPGGRVFRRLDFTPTPGAHVENGLIIHGETPERVANIWQAAGIISNQLSDAGAYTVRGQKIFSKCMKEFIEWHEQFRHNRKIHSQAKHSLERFGDCRLNSIKRDDVRQWIQKDLSKKYSGKTISNIVAVPLQMYNWMTREKNYDGLNPFEKHEWNSTEATRAIKPTVTADEFQRLINAAKNPQMIQAAHIGYYTGLRPSEVCRVTPSDFDHERLTLRVKVEKTRGKPFVRFIAIPRTLSVWILNHDFEKMNEYTIRNGFKRITNQDMSLSGLCMESFRKSFAALLESLGASHETIDAHQGRAQDAVITRHYLKDKMRAANLARPFISRAFDGDDGQILRVLK